MVDRSGGVVADARGVSISEGYGGVLTAHIGVAGSYVRCCCH